MHINPPERRATHPSSERTHPKECVTQTVFQVYSTSPNVRATHNKWWSTEEPLRLVPADFDNLVLDCSGRYFYIYLIADRFSEQGAADR